MDRSPKSLLTHKRQTAWRVPEERVATCRGRERRWSQEKKVTRTLMALSLAGTMNNNDGDTLT